MTFAATRRLRMLFSIRKPYTKFHMIIGEVQKTDSVTQKLHERWRTNFDLWGYRRYKEFLAAPSGKLSLLGRCAKCTHWSTGRTKEPV